MKLVLNYLCEKRGYFLKMFLSIKQQTDGIVNNCWREFVTERQEHIRERRKERQWVRPWIRKRDHTFS